MTESKKLDKEFSIKANIIDEEFGIRKFVDINAIRIKSKDYRILILSDFTPMLGEIHGDISILSKDGSVEFKDLDGYYMHQNNEFTLIIKKNFEGWHKDTK